MQQSIIRNKVLLGIVFGALASGCVAHIPEQRNAEPSLTRPEGVQLIPAGAQRTEPGEKAPGIIVHIDPKSGEFTIPPSRPMPAQGPQQSLERAAGPASELHETLSPVPGGGVMIHLGERSFTPLTATIDANGNLRLEHQPPVPDPPDNK